MGVNKVEVNGETILDLTSSTVTPETLSEGVTAFNAAGDPITGTQTAVQYGKAQSLTEAQKTQARSNIGAVTLEEVIDSIKVEYPEAHVIYASKEEPRYGRAHSRQNGSRLRRSDGPAHDHEGPAPCLQQGYAGG